MQPIGLDEIAQTCLIISRNVPKQSFQVTCSRKFNSILSGTGEVEFPEDWTINIRQNPSKMGGSLAMDFGGFNCAASISNIEGSQFSPVLLSSSLLINDNITCNIQTANIDPIALSTNIRTDRTNTTFSLSASEKWSQIAYSISSGILVNNSFLFGLGVSQDNQFAPFKLMSSFCANLGLLQFSGNIERPLTKTHDYTLGIGTNFLLDPNNIINFSLLKMGNNGNLALGYRGLIKDTQVNTTIATDGVITSMFTRQITDGITFSTGLSYQVALGSLIPSIEIHLST